MVKTLGFGKIGSRGVAQMGGIKMQIGTVTAGDAGSFQVGPFRNIGHVGLTPINNANAGTCVWYGKGSSSGKYVLVQNLYLGTSGPVLGGTSKAYPLSFVVFSY